MDTGSVVDASRRRSPAVVVVGNSKGGTGKSTIAMHLAIGLLYKGYEVGVLDLDPEQGTITRYLANRRSWRSLDTTTEAVRRFPMPRQANLPGAVARMPSTSRRISAIARSLTSLFTAVLTTNGPAPRRQSKPDEAP